MCLAFSLYSTFNALFNIQLSIQHSTVHFKFNSSFTHSVIYSTISTIHSTFNFNSTFNYSFSIQLLVSVHQLFWALTTPGQWRISLLFKNTAKAAVARILATEIEAYEYDTRPHFEVDVESDLFWPFLDSVLQRTDQISQTKVDEEIVEQHIVVVDQMVSLLPILRESSSNVNAYDKQTLDNDIYVNMEQQVDKWLYDRIFAKSKTRLSLW